VYDAGEVASAEKTPAEIIQEHLARSLGPHTARNALTSVARRALHAAPDEVTRANAPALLLALRPMLRTLLGAAQCDTIVDDVTRELKR
jgi:hypothetical protein